MISRHFKSKNLKSTKVKAIDYKRKYLNKIETSTFDENYLYIDKNLLNIEIKDEIEQILNFLSKEEKEIFKRYYINDENINNIAKDKKLSVSSIYSKLSRGRNKLRKILLKEGGK